MKYRKLGNTDIDVSVICLGTMTFGKQNTEAEAHEQLDYAVSQGVNFIDTAELYSIPPEAETYTLTEQYIGRWLEKQKREDLIIASKVMTTSANQTAMPWIRNGQTKFDKKNIHEAVEGSLKRLKTDYLDLYQLHWPERATNFFGIQDYKHPENDEWTPLEETLEAMAELVKQGKIRHIGISNETPWGTMKFLQLAEKMGLPKPVSVQNPYSLINRIYEVGMAEVSMRENIPLLAYSPLAGGVLTGKYLNGRMPKGSRMDISDRFHRYLNSRSEVATKKYIALAQEHGLTPAQLALSFVNNREFLTSNIIGATTMEQLKENIASIDINLTSDVMAEIEKIHMSSPNPGP